MSLRAFLVSLLETGKVRVDRPREESARDLVGAEDLLRQMDGHARLELAFDPPRLLLPSAVWGAATLYHGCQLLAHREASGDYVHKALSQPCPERPSAESAYSVDLALRFLPDLLSLARGIAEEDPLVAELSGIARAWPLSSVGARGVEPIDVSSFVDHRCLRVLYTDRVIERRDLSRLSDARVREAVREAIGIHESLWPEGAAVARGASPLRKEPA